MVKHFTICLKCDHYDTICLQWHLHGCWKLQVCCHKKLSWTSGWRSHVVSTQARSMTIATCILLQCRYTTQLHVVRYILFTLHIISPNVFMFCFILLQLFPPFSGRLLHLSSHLISTNTAAYRPQPTDWVMILMHCRHMTVSQTPAAHSSSVLLLTGVWDITWKYYYWSLIITESWFHWTLEFKCAQMNIKNLKCARAWLQDDNITVSCAC